MLITRQNSIFISPQDCGSSVGYYITTNEWTRKDKPTKYNINATVVLADCSHKIDWGFVTSSEATESGDNLEKIDAAISMLQEFRKAYVETEKIISKLNKG